MSGYNFGETKGPVCIEIFPGSVKLVKVVAVAQMGLFALVDKPVICWSLSFHIGNLNQELSFLHVFLMFQELEPPSSAWLRLLRLVECCLLCKRLKLIDHGYRSTFNWAFVI